MTALQVLAAEEITNRTLWDPTVKGVLVVAAAITLFIGSVYLLLSTNLGARLGFLLTAAGVSGFMIILSSLWLTNTDPLQSLRGRIPEWKGEEVVATVDDSTIAAVRAIPQDGRDVAEGDVAGVDAAVEQVLTSQDSEFAQFTSSTDYLVLGRNEIGGESKDVFWHVPLYATAEICPVDTEALDVPLGDPIPEPQCQAGEPTQTVVLLRDLGSLRQPPAVVLGAAIILFVLSLLGLHWRERDQQREREVAEAGEGSDEDRTLEPV